MNWTPFVLLFCLAGLSVADDIHVDRVIGPEFPGKYKHPASIEQLSNGDLFIAYYGGDGEYAEDTAVFGMRRKAGESQWSKPVIIADTPFRSEGNAVIWQAPDGLAWLFYVCRYGATWSESRIKAKISRDHGQTWSDPMIIAFELGMMVRNRPLVLKNGNYLLPVYHEKGGDRESVDASSVSCFLEYDPKTKAWTRTGQIVSDRGNIQPGIVELEENRLIAYCRRGGGYEPDEKGFIVRAESNDGGKTWSKGIDSKFPNPNAAIEFLRLRNGHLLLIYNNSMNDRTPLSAALSIDNDRTYPYRRDLLTGNGPFAYPYAIQAVDGKIHLIYTTEERSVIMHAVFDENAILKP